VLSEQKRSVQPVSTYQCLRIEVLSCAWFRSFPSRVYAFTFRSAESNPWTDHATQPSSAASWLNSLSFTDPFYGFFGLTEWLARLSLVRNQPVPSFRFKRFFLKKQALARIFHESPATIMHMGILPGVLGSHTLRRTVRVRLGSETLRFPGGTPICTISQRQFMKYPG
jgi:hypothetical protein